MNFQIKDSPLFVGVASALVSFALGLFSALFISGTNIFIINLFLFLIGVSLIIVGIGLLIAAIEVHVKVKDFSKTLLTASSASFYNMMVGENTDSMSASEVLEALQSEDPELYNGIGDRAKVKTLIDAVPVKQKEGIFDQTQDVLLDEKIVTGAYGPSQLSSKEKTTILAGLTAEEIIGKSYCIEKAIKETKIKEPIKPKLNLDKHIQTPAIISIPYPKLPPGTKSAIQEDSSEKVTMDVAVTTENDGIILDEVQPNVVESNTVVPDVTSMDSDTVNKQLRKIVLIGGKGINVNSADYRQLLMDALALAEAEDGYVLRLKGKTHGLGARGVKTVRKNTEFVSFDKNDLKKMIKKAAI